jgi:RHS repeat-associated protein
MLKSQISLKSVEICVTTLGATPRRHRSLHGTGSSAPRSSWVVMAGRRPSTAATKTSGLSPWRRAHSSPTSLPACPPPASVLSDRHAMTATPPWSTAATFPVSIRRREAGRIRGTALVCGGSSAGLGSVRRQTRPRSPGSRNTGNTLDSKELANNCSGEKTMHVACYGYRYFDPLTGRWMSKDPFGEMGGLNLYGFVGNACIYIFDRLGLQFWEGFPLPGVGGPTASDISPGQALDPSDGYGFWETSK